MPKRRRRQPDKWRKQHRCNGCGHIFKATTLKEIDMARVREVNKEHLFNCVKYSECPKCFVHVCAVFSMS